MPSILWRRLDVPGHESARLAREASGWRLDGSAVFAHEGRPCRLSYAIVCDVLWRTLSADVAGWIGDRVIDVALTVEGERGWRANGVARPDLAGCVDVDLNFSPSTNTLPIRRLGLAVGSEAPVHAAWLRFPDLTLERLDQVYRRAGATTYAYASRGAAFTAEIEVNDVGLVTRYPGAWQEER